MRRRNLAFGAAALLLTATPALAHWGTTHWGMTAEEVIATVPGAVATAAEKGTDVRDLHQRATAPYADGDVATVASFLFDSNGLAFVGLTPTDIRQCEAYRKTLVARHGEGKTIGQKIGDVSLGKTSWVDPASHDRLMFSWFRRPNGAYAICKFITEKP